MLKGSKYLNWRNRYSPTQDSQRKNAAQHSKHYFVRDFAIGPYSLIRLYEAWHEAEPEKGYDAKAAEYRALSEELSRDASP